MVNYNVKNILQGNNIEFRLDDGSKINLDKGLTSNELKLLDNSHILINGKNNKIIVYLNKRSDIEIFLASKGLIIDIYGFNNEIELNKIHYYYRPLYDLKGLNISLGNDADLFLYPEEMRYVSNCKVSIGENTLFCGARLFLQDDNSSITIGKDCMFSWGIDVWCTDVHTITDLEGNPLNYGKSIEIGDHVWVGRDVKIGKNTKISSNSVVGWNSVVTKKFEEKNVIIGGNPASIIKRNINWDPRDLQNYTLKR